MNGSGQYDCNNPEFSGYLTKQSAWLKDWRRRYFILKGSKLFFAKVRLSELRKQRLAHFHSASPRKAVRV